LSTNIILLFQHKPDAGLVVPFVLLRNQDMLISCQLMIAGIRWILVITIHFEAKAVNDLSFSRVFLKDGTKFNLY